MVHYPNLAQGSGRTPVLLIIPEDDVYAEYSTCTLCTWVGVGHKRMKLKCVSAACAQHAHLPRIRA